MKRLISIAVSAVVLGIIYWRIDLGGMWRAFGDSDLIWLFVAILLLVPAFILGAVRFLMLVPDNADISLGESLRLILATASLNMVLPSRIGDFAKAWFIRDRGHMAGSKALALVIYEKACDLLALLFWCALGLLLYPEKDALFWTMTLIVLAGFAFGLGVIGVPAVARAVFAAAIKISPVRFRARFEALADNWRAMHDWFWQDGARVRRIAAMSAIAWFVHLLQIWMFTIALNASVPLIDSLALAPLAILAGLLPLTFAGIGTRDAALIYFYAPYMSAPVGAALGILCTLRYILPALAGLPFLGNYLSVARREMAIDRRTTT